jgi:hypothetical protein
MNLAIVLQPKSSQKGLLKYDRYTNTPFYVVIALGSGPCRTAFALDTAGASYYQVRAVDLKVLSNDTGGGVRVVSVDRPIIC